MVVVVVVVVVVMMMGKRLFLSQPFRRQNYLAGDSSLTLDSNFYSPSLTTRKVSRKAVSIQTSANNNTDIHQLA